MSFLQSLGIWIIGAGVLLEISGIVAMTSYEFRRRLPLKSPLQLVGIGGVVLVVGILVGSFATLFDPNR